MYERLLRMFVERNRTLGEDFVIGLADVEEELTDYDRGLYVGLVGMVRAKYVENLKGLGIRVKLEGTYFNNVGNGVVECYVNSRDMFSIVLGKDIDLQIEEEVALAYEERRKSLGG